MCLLCSSHVPVHIRNASSGGEEKLVKRPDWSVFETALSNWTKTKYGPECGPAFSIGDAARKWEATCKWMREKQGQICIVTNLHTLNVTKGIVVKHLSDFKACLDYFLLSPWEGLNGDTCRYHGLSKRPTWSVKFLHWNFSLHPFYILWHNVVQRANYCNDYLQDSLTSGHQANSLY